MPSIVEIVLLLIIFVLVFCLGKLNTLGKTAVKVKDEFKEGLATGDPRVKPPAVKLDPEAKDQPFSGPKPGTRTPGMEDAEIEEPS